jgi:hypothetical protein
MTQSANRNDIDFLGDTTKVDPLVESAANAAAAAFLLTKAEKLGKKGNVKQAQALMVQAQTLIKTVKEQQILARARVVIHDHYKPHARQNYFQRQENELLKRSKDLELGRKANLTTTQSDAWESQKKNRNIDAGMSLILDEDGVDPNALPGERRPGDKSKCSRYCRSGTIDKQGRTSCGYCGGIGFNAREAQIKAKGK